MEKTGSAGGRSAARERTALLSGTTRRCGRQDDEPDNLEDHRARARSVRRDRLRYQQHSDLRRGCESRVGSGAEPVPAPRGPRAESRRDGESVRRARTRNTASGRGSTGQSFADERDARDHQRPCRAESIRSEPGRADQRVVAIARRGRTLPRSQSQPELPRATVPARGYGEPDRRRAPRLHTGRAEVQHGDPYLPGSTMARRVVQQSTGARIVRSIGSGRYRAEGRVLIRTLVLLLLIAPFALAPGATSAAAVSTTRNAPLGLVGRVVDGADVLSVSTEAQLTQRLADFEKSSGGVQIVDRKSTRLNSSHLGISYAVFCLKK